MPNIEIKAKARDIETIKKIVDRIKTDYIGKLHQIDTYYPTQEGRLKLREINNKETLLIPYLKEYSAGPMKSCYSVLQVKDTDNTKRLLEKILGLVAVVDKKREVFLVDNVRVHLDEVKGLGSFVELEAVYEEGSSEENEVMKVSKLMETLGIIKNDLLDRSYIDYLLMKNSFDNLEVIYSFENDSIIISEFKRNDLCETKPVNERFHWLLYHKENMRIEKLDFLSMDSDLSEERRVFSQGDLSFGTLEGTFKISKQIHTLCFNSDFNDDYRFSVIEYFKTFTP